MPVRPRMMLVATLLGLSACGGADWRAGVRAAAEAQIRSLIQDPSARFARVQVTGDDRTGQTCGFVSSGRGAPQRFIVYIDQTAGPFVESFANEGMREQFDAAWQADCVREGYSA